MNPIQFLRKSVKLLAEAAQNPSIFDNVLKKGMDFAAGLESPKRNPDDLITKKGKTLTLYDVMMLDDVISSTVTLIKAQALIVPWSIEPASEDPKDKAVADFVENVLKNQRTKIKDQMKNWLDAKVYGHRVAEKIWAVKDGMVVLSDLKFMHPIFFDYQYDESGYLSSLCIGEQYGSTQYIHGDDVYRKFALMTWPYKKDGNLYGDSDLREIYEEWNSKVYIRRWRAQYVQNFGAPIPSVTYDKDTVNASEKAEMEDTLKNLQDNYYIIQPGVRNADGKLSGKFDIQLIETKAAGSGQLVHNQVLVDIDTAIRRKLLMPDKMGFSASPGGSYSLGEVQFEIYQGVLEDHRDAVADVYNTQIIPQLVRYNFDVDKMPTFKFSKPTATMQADMIRTLIEKGIVDPAEKWIRARVGADEITQAERDEIDLQKASRPAPVLQPPAMFKAENPRTMLEKYYNDLDKLDADFEKAYREAHAKQSDYISRQVQKKVLPTSDLAPMNAMEIDKGEFKRIFQTFFTKLYIYGKTDAIEQNRKRFKDATKAKLEGKYTPCDEAIKLNLANFDDNDMENWLDREWVDGYLREYGELGTLSQADIKALKNIRQEAFYITGVQEERMLKAAFEIVSNGLKAQMQPREIISQLEAVLSEDRRKYSTTIARTNEAKYYNTGRMNEFLSPEVGGTIEAYLYEAVMDDATTPFCEQHNGQIIRASDPELLSVNPPNHYNCRSILVPIFIGEDENEDSYFKGWKDRFDEWKGGERPAKGFGGPI